MTRRIFFVALGIHILFPVLGQDFGFGEPEAGTNAFGVAISGEMAAQLTAYLEDFTDFSTFKKTSLGDVFAGKLNIKASGFNAEGTLNLKVAPVFDGSASPVELDEAYLRAYFGKLIVEGGLRKLTWGKADSFGPLDVVNPRDYRDLTDIANQLDRKISRPMIHGTYQFGSFSKLEAVFLPGFEGHRFAESGRWTPVQAKIEHIRTGVAEGLTMMPSLSSAEKKEILEYYANMTISYPKTLGLEYAQMGLRFTATIGSADIGAQYFWGNLFRPAITVSGSDPAEFLQNPRGITPEIAYNRYHHAGLDYGQIVAGFNLRAELGANITGDLAGDDGLVYNPQILWSLGFDRDIFWGINLNVQAVEGIRLRWDKIADNPVTDTEAEAPATSTRITGILSKKFLRDELEVKVTGLWGLEDKDFFILPAIIWTKDDIALEGSAGFLGGNSQGELGQYRKNSFVKLKLSYRF